MQVGTVHISSSLAAFALLVVLVVLAYVFLFSRTSEPFANEDEDKKAQITLLNETYSPTAMGKRSVEDSFGDMPESEQCFVNFYAMGCRYPSFIGPMAETGGYLNSDIAVQTAVQAGCRVFVLDIDYYEKDCETIFPRLVVNDKNERNIIKGQTGLEKCNTRLHSNIKELCEKIATYAYADSCPQKDDPLVLVLYFHSVPKRKDGSSYGYNEKQTLDYYSEVAKALAPLRDRMLTNEAGGGTFYRQSQEGQLLIQPITNFKRKILVFSNANTSGFREKLLYPTEEDLDYMVHLRLSYTQSKLGITENDSGSLYGILQTAEDYMSIPPDRVQDVAEQTKLRWTVCLSRDSSASVPAETYNKITAQSGVHCVPALLFDTKGSSHLFGDKTFKKHAFIPKPMGLRYTKPPITTPAKPNPSTDAKQGALRAPTL
jgi:hypothetical protein